jgi:predicted SAM-dependent methyltransferase
MKLHIGGQQVHSDWQILDIEDRPEVDFVGDAQDLSQFEDGSIEMIYASHVLEHFHYGVGNELMNTLREWFRVLEPGGHLLISVPNLRTLCGLYGRPDLGPEDRYHLMRIIFGGHTNEFDVHRVGFDPDILVSYLHGAGFEEWMILDVGFDLFEDCSLVEFKGVMVSLNMMATKPIRDID